jgi:hypothetical protein
VDDGEKRKYMYVARKDFVSETVLSLLSFCFIYPSPKRIDEKRETATHQTF